MAHRVAIFGKYLYVDDVDEIFHPHPHILHMRIIRMNRIFRIQMANPNWWSHFYLKFSIYMIFQVLEESAGDRVAFVLRDLIKS